MESPPVPASSSSNPAQRAAKASLLAPVFAIGLVFALRSAVAESKDITIAIVSVSGFGLLVLTGGLAGIVALCLMRRHGRKGVWVRASVGIVLNVLLLASMVIGVDAASKTRRKALAGHDLDKRIDDVSQKMRDLGEKSNDPHSKDFKEGAMNAVGDTAAGFDDMAKQTSGVERVIYKVMADWGHEQQAKLETQSRLSRAFDEAGGLTAKGIESQDKISRQLETVSEWSQSLVAMRKDAEQIPDQLRAGLLKLNMPAGEIERQVQKMVVALHIDLVNRQFDAQQALLGAIRDRLVLLNDQWGKWKVDAESDSLSIPDEKTLNEFNRLVLVQQKANAEAAEIQKEIIAVQRKLSGPR
ncbi:MAG: hypothetical protein NTW19_25520 [Planctomycetota bacterium]|nr:hypothetical protein [Planctomycetota bacterium]